MLKTITFKSSVNQNKCFRFVLFQLVHNERFVKPIVNAKAICQKKIDFSEKAIWQESGQKYLWEAKRVSENYN